MDNKWIFLFVLGIAVYSVFVINFGNSFFYIRELITFIVFSSLIFYCFKQKEKKYRILVVLFTMILLIHLMKVIFGVSMGLGGFIC